MTARGVLAAAAGRRARVVIAAAALAVVLLAACGGGSGADPGASPASAAQLTSVMAGSDVVLGPDDVEAANVIGLDLVTLAAPLTTWWSTLNDPAVPERDWLAAAPGLLDVMRTTVDHIGAQLGPGRDPQVRATYQPYLQRWRAILAALEDLRVAVASGDRTGQLRATAAYNEEIAAVGRLDQARVARVVDVYGPEEAARALRAQGLDPSRFGL